MRTRRKTHLEDMFIFKTKYFKVQENKLWKNHSLPPLYIDLLRL